MKISVLHYNLIEKYLKAQKLKSKEFYDESIDHFICKIENELEQGKDFYLTFELCAKQFEKASYQSFPFIHYKGWAALEYNFEEQKKQQYEKKINQFTKKQFLSFRLVFWTLLMVYYWQIMPLGNWLFVLPFILIIAAGLMLPFSDRDVRSYLLRTLNESPKIKNLEHWLLAKQGTKGLAFLLLPYIVLRLLISPESLDHFTFEFLRFSVVFYLCIFQWAKVEYYISLKQKQKFQYNETY